MTELPAGDVNSVRRHSPVVIERTSPRAVIEASVVTLALFLLWWGGVRYLDGTLAAALPYHRYETVALLYPDVYYPGLLGWIVASTQPFTIGVWLVFWAGWSSCRWPSEPVRPGTGPDAVDRRLSSRQRS